MAHEGHEHGPDCNHDHEDGFEIEVVELEDENGEKEDFAILEELDFEGRHFCILAPLEEVQAQSEGERSHEEGLSIEIFEVKDDMFSALEDEALANRLMAHLDEQAAKLAKEEDED
ncbi:MAG TPA: DUF1292 domain-containing protein [Holophagaceae bacterium]|nr:DUF1292 domain-containing protein [Holophagaceae bacterium]